MLILRHYTQAYAYLLELRITDANINEIKIAACYIGYKVWKLSFLLNLPREAISRFKNHLDFFRQRIGHPLSRFEHSAWLAHQYNSTQFPVLQVDGRLIHFLPKVYHIWKAVRRGHRIGSAGNTSTAPWILLSASSSTRNQQKRCLHSRLRHSGFK